MARWVRVDGDGSTKQAYMNLDQVQRLRVVPLVADPSQFAIEVDSTSGGTDGHGMGYETVAGNYTSLDAANTALRELTQGFDPSA